MGDFSAVIGDLIKNLASGAGTFLFQDLTNNVDWKRWKVEYRLTNNDGDFLDRYAETLVALKLAEKPVETLQFFGQESVINIFYDYRYGQLDDTSFKKQYEELIQWFTIDKQLSEKGFSAEAEINFFIDLFNDAVNRSRSASEREHFQLTQKILAEVQKGATAPIIPQYLTRIPSIDLEREFIGREADLQRLKEKLEKSSKVVLVNGLGGIGKTVLATAYVQTYADEFDHLVWVNRGEDLVDAFALNAELADTLGLPFQNDENLNDRFHRILWALQKIPGNNILVVDNAQEQIADKEVLERLPGPPFWRVLLTSRLELAAFEQVRLDILNPDAAKGLFRIYFHGSHTETELVELLEEIGYHTLTIELLARLLNKSNNLLNISELTAILRQKQLDDPDLQEKVWARHRGEERGIFLHLMKAFELSQLDEKEKWLLKQFVILPVEQYSVATLVDFLQEKPLGLNNVLNTLAAKGLLTFHEDKSFSIHRIIRQVAEYQLQPEFEDGATLVESMTQKMDVDVYTSRIEAASWIGYATTVANYFTTKLHGQMVILQSYIGLTYRALGQYEQALSFQQKELVAREAILGANHPALSASYSNIGLTYRDLGQNKQALDYHQKALAIRGTLLRANHPDLATSYNNIGLTYSDLGQYEKAIDYYLKALEILEPVLDANHPNLAKLYNNIAGTYRALDQYEQALYYHQKCLTIDEAVLEPDHPDLATDYNNIAVTYYVLTQYEQALYYHQKSLAIRKAVLGANHPYLAQSYNNIAVTYRALGQNEQALSYHQKAVVIEGAVLKANHPDLATTYNNIGLTYRDLGQYEKALGYFQKATAILEAVLEVNHLDLATSYHNIADTFSDLGQFQQALGYFQKAVAIEEKALETNHPDLATSYNNIGFVHRNLGQYEQALGYFQKALAIQEEVLDANHPDLAKLYNNVAVTFSDLGQYKQALDYHQKALAIDEAMLEANHPDLATSYHNIGLAFRDLGQYEQALDYCKKALVILETVLEDNHPTLATFYNNIATLYMSRLQLFKAYIFFRKASLVGKSGND